MKITVLGLGAMGARMATRLAAAGHDVTGWNRSPVDPAAGVKLTRTPAEAAVESELVIAMVRDDVASEAVWEGDEGALAAMPSSALAVESSTVSHARMAALGEAAAAHGRHLIDAPVLGSRPQADAGQLVHLIGGLARDVAVAAPAFAALSSAQLHVGPLGSGTALKLAANALLGIQVAAVAELLARTQRLGLDPVRAVDLLGQTPVLGLAAKGAAALMLAGKDAPLFPVDLVAKDFGYAIDDPATMPIAAAAARVFDAASAAGLAARNLTAVATLY